MADIGRLTRTISILGAFFLFGRILRSSRGLGGIRGHSLSHLNILSIHPRLFCYFWRVARGGKDLVAAALLEICNLERGVYLGATKGKGTNGWRIVDTLCLPKHK